MRGAVIAPTRSGLFLSGWESWVPGLETTLQQSVGDAEQGMGHLEEQLLVKFLEVQRRLLERTVQAKADAAPPCCPVCGQPLTRKERGHQRTVQTRFGLVKFRRTRGWCARCQQWRFPADALLRLGETGNASPGLQEAAALLVSQMPVGDATTVLERLTGVKWSTASLDREARRQGCRAEQQRAADNAALGDWEKLVAAAQAAARSPKPAQGFTMVVQVDAWNIRERDNWGQTEPLRVAGESPSRWHWVYGATLFRLDQRGQTAGGRPVITERGYVMTRGGVDGLRELLWAEAVRRGVLAAERVLVIADGAVWIWKLVADRFGGAVQQLDLWHARQHLWAVAHALQGRDTPEAAAWVEPLLRQLQAGEAAKVIVRLNELPLPTAPAAAEVLERERQYFQANAARLDYARAVAEGWPLGSGAMESTCHQYQCRFKRPGQFWSTAGDEALLALHDYWRNGRWRRLFPHVGCAHFSLN